MLQVAVAHAGPPDFKSFGNKQGCNAVPYDDMRADCEAAKKAVDNACHKTVACDTTAADIKSEVGAIQQDHKEMAKTEQKRKSDVAALNTAEYKNDNTPEVEQKQATVRDDDDKERAIQNDENAHEDKLRDIESAHVDAWQDCMRARADLAEIFDKAERQVARDASNDNDDAEACYASLDKALVSAAPAVKDVKEMQLCLDVRNQPLKVVDGPVSPSNGCIGAGAYTGKLGWDHPLNKAQAWCNYQQRKNYKDPSDKVEGWWSDAYDRLKASVEAGREFERKALLDRGFAESNKAIMLAPKAANDNRVPDCALKLSDSFIPDGVGGGPVELEWGAPYDFYEVKNRKKLDNEGNVKKMLDYVEACGGTLTLIIRYTHVDDVNGAKPKPETQLTTALVKRIQTLANAQRVFVQWFP